MFDGFNRNDAIIVSCRRKKSDEFGFAEILTSGMYLAIANSLLQRFSEVACDLVIRTKATGG